MGELIQFPERRGEQPPFSDEAKGALDKARGVFSDAVEQAASTTGAVATGKKLADDIKASDDESWTVVRLSDET